MNFLVKNNPIHIVHVPVHVEQRGRRTVDKYNDRDKPSILIPSGMVTTSLLIVYGYVDNFCAFSALITSNCSSDGNSTLNKRVLQNAS